MLGIKCKFECPTCGNIIKADSPFWNKDLRKKLKEPIKCGCGRKGNFTMIGFEPCQYEIVPEGWKVVETDEKLKEEKPVEE